jgi:hypothetical protein
VWPGRREQRQDAPTKTWKAREGKLGREDEQQQRDPDSGADPA